MKPMDTPAEQFRCGMEATLSVIGGKWKIMLVWFLLDGTRRFGAFRRQFPEITQKVLTQQLRELEADGVVRREVFPVVPSRVEYSLTPFGQSLRPLIGAIEGWGLSHVERLAALKQCRPAAKAHAAAVS